MGLLVLLMSLTMVYQPLVLPMLLPDLSVSPMPIARTLVLTVLLPLVLGMLLKARWPALAGRLRPALARLGNISVVLSCFILLPFVYLDALKDVALNGGGLLVLLLYLPLAVGAGWWLGGPDAHQRRLLALCCGQGSMGAAFVIAVHNFNNPHVIAMLLLILWASLALLIPLALIFRRQSLGEVEDLSEKSGSARSNTNRRSHYSVDIAGSAKSTSRRSAEMHLYALQQAAQERSRRDRGARRGAEIADVRQNREAVVLRGLSIRSARVGAYLSNRFCNSAKHCRTCTNSSGDISMAPEKIRSVLLTGRRVPTRMGSCFWVAMNRERTVSTSEKYTIVLGSSP